MCQEWCDSQALPNYLCPCFPWRAEHCGFTHVMSLWRVRASKGPRCMQSHCSKCTPSKMNQKVTALSSRQSPSSSFKKMGHFCTHLIPISEGWEPPRERDRHARSQQWVLGQQRHDVTNPGTEMHRNILAHKYTVWPLIWFFFKWMQTPVVLAMRLSQFLYWDPPLLFISRQLS